LIARSFGMELVKMDKKIYGKTEIKFNNWEKRFVFESHTWEIKSLTNDFNILATSKNFNNKKIIEFFEHKKYPIFGMQFHPAARLKNLEEDNFLDGDEIFFELLQKIF
jgi:GMP synthase-like glutamine amidotransferase